MKNLWKEREVTKWQGDSVWGRYREISNWRLIKRWEKGKNLNGGSINEEEVFELVDDVIKHFAQEAKRVRRDVILPLPHSIEKNVKIHDRGSTKRRESEWEWEYDTLAEINRPLKEAKAQEPKQRAL